MLVTNEQEQLQIRLRESMLQEKLNKSGCTSVTAKVQCAQDCKNLLCICQDTHLALLSIYNNNKTRNRMYTRSEPSRVIYDCPQPNGQPREQDKIYYWLVVHTELSD